MRKNDSYTVWLKKSIGFFPYRETMGPLLLIILMPPLMVLLPFILTDLDGSGWQVIQMIKNRGLYKMLSAMQSPFGDPVAMKIALTIIVSQMILVKIIPGEIYKGPPTSGGNSYEYLCNGFNGFIITSILFILAVRLGLYPGGILLDKLTPFISFMNVIAILFCLFLYFKGLYAPSSNDNGSTNNFLFDYFNGTELNPKILSFDVKQMTNSRFGMIFYGLFMISAMFKQYELFHYVSDNLIISAGLQLLYVLKFFYWEKHYYSSYDIHHDYAGFYLCWGCLVFMPGIYTSSVLFITYHPHDFGLLPTSLLLAFGILITYIQYDADTQARRFRANPNGNVNNWGRPAQYIEATYITGDGEKHKNLLLCSGYYGDLKIRNIRYPLEWILTALWVLPTCTSKILPNIYFIYSVLLLIDRMYRIENRCANKYGKYWDDYCKKVPYYLIPYLY